MNNSFDATSYRGLRVIGDTAQVVDAQRDIAHAISDGAVLIDPDGDGAQVCGTREGERLSLGEVVAGGGGSGQA